MASRPYQEDDGSHNTTDKDGDENGDHNSRPHFSWTVENASQCVQSSPLSLRGLVMFTLKPSSPPKMSRRLIMYPLVMSIA